MPELAGESGTGCHTGVTRVHLVDFVLRKEDSTFALLEPLAQGLSKAKSQSEHQLTMNDILGRTRISKTLHGTAVEMCGRRDSCPRRDLKDD